MGIKNQSFGMPQTDRWKVKFKYAFQHEFRINKILHLSGELKFCLFI